MSPPATFTITVATERVQLARKAPNRGRPAFSVLYPDGNSTDVAHYPVFNPRNFRNKAANDGWVMGAATDPLASAL